jgi:hypothetical protein
MALIIPGVLQAGPMVATILVFRTGVCLGGVLFISDMRLSKPFIDNVTDPFHCDE